MKQRSSLQKARESLRLEHTYNTISLYGMDFVLDRGIIGNSRRFFLKKLYGVPQPDEPVPLPVKVRLMLQELGPVYVKVGQLISSQAQALPPDWAEQFAKLQSNVRPFPYEQVNEIIVAELGAPPEELFATIDHEPLAAASLAQVHRATLKSGEQVVLKVQRPNSQKQVKADVGIMDWLARLAAGRIGWARDIDLVGMVDEFGSQVLLELDYTIEAYNAFRLNQNLAIIPGVRVPVFYDNLSTRRVLTMEYVDGFKITNIPAIEAAGFDRAKLAQDFLRSTLKQVLIDGFFHGDLHPGNVNISRKDGTIIYLDMGMMGELDVRERMNLASLLFALNQGDVRGMGQAVRALSVPFRTVDEQVFQKAFERRVGRLMQQTNVPMATIMNDVMDVMRENGLQFNSDLTLAVKSIIQMEAIGLALFPKVGLIKEGVQITLELIQQEVTPEKIANTVIDEATFTIRQVMQELPSLQEATQGWLKQYKKGRFEVYLDTSGFNAPMAQLESLTRYIILGILLTGIIVGSAIATGIAAAFDVSRSELFTVIAFTGYMAATVIAAVLSLILLWQLWSKRPRRRY